MRWGYVVIILLLWCWSSLEAHGQNDEPSPKEAVPLEQPVPSYPFLAGLFGMSGYCEVRFDVDERGYSFNHYTTCTDYVFCFQSKKAVTQVLFKPAYRHGEPRVRRNVIYPLEYIMEGDESGSVDRDRLKPCRKVPIS